MDIFCPKCDRKMDRHFSGTGFTCPMHGYLHISRITNRDKEIGTWLPNDEPKEDHSKVCEWGKITVGTESKGRVEIPMPSNLTPVEAKKRIDDWLSYLLYSKNVAEDLGLVIFPEKKPDATQKKKKKKNEDEEDE